MTAFMIILCAVSITASVFLICRFAIKRHGNDEYVSVNQNKDI